MKAIIAIVAVALCLGCTRGGSVAATAAEPKTHTVTIDGLRFQPEDLTVKAGDSVIWVNKDPFPHTVTSTEGKFDSREMLPDKSWTFVTAAEGEFAYVCSLHPTMKARLRVISAR